jgi:hypothetical protein
MRKESKIEPFKAHLVAGGFSQVMGKDYTETFALTVYLDSAYVFSNYSKRRLGML